MGEFIVHVPFHGRWQQQSKVLWSLSHRAPRYGHPAPVVQIGFGWLAMPAQQCEPGSTTSHAAHGHVVHPRAGKYCSQLPAKHTSLLAHVVMQSPQWVGSVFKS
jgi:hypothetical protein